MKFVVPISLPVLAKYIPPFVALVGSSEWEKRAKHLLNEAGSERATSKITRERHWFELELDLLRRRLKSAGRISARVESRQTRSALYFAASIVETHKRMSASGKKVLKGRLRDALWSGVGFSPLYVELETASILMHQGFDVEFPDMDGKSSFDLFFRLGAVQGEIECKSLSADAGRKIHRKDFYRFIDSILSIIEMRSNTVGVSDVLMVTLHDRLPSNDGSLRALRQHVVEILTRGNIAAFAGPYFDLRLDRYERYLGRFPIGNDRIFHQRCQKAFGQNCHVAGGAGKGGSCLIVMRSAKEDDHSLPILKAMKKASAQFSATRPGIICVQFDDIEASDLTLPHLRERLGLLSNYFFHEKLAAHVAAVNFSAYGTTASIAPHDLGTASIAIWNPNIRYTVDGMPFRDHVPDDLFRALTKKPDYCITQKDLANVPSSKAWYRRHRAK